MSRKIHLAGARVAILESGALALACLLAFWLVTHLLSGCG